MSMMMSRMTIPRMPWAWASGGYTGRTVLLRFGEGTSVPATFGASSANRTPGLATEKGRRAQTTRRGKGTRGRDTTMGTILPLFTPVCPLRRAPRGSLVLFLDLATIRLGGRDDLLLEVGGHLVVVGHLHAVDAAGTGHRGQVRIVGEHLREGNLRLDHLEGALRLHPLGPTASAGEISHHRSRVLLRHRNRDLHHRLEDRGATFRDGVLVGQGARDLEGELGRVDIVVLAVEE